MRTRLAQATAALILAASLAAIPAARNDELTPAALIPQRPPLTPRTWQRHETQAQCLLPGPWSRAARINRLTLRSMGWAPFGRPEIGWETYAPLIAREIGTDCAPATPGFAAAYADWQARQRLPATGLLNGDDFLRLKGVLQTRRAFVRLSAQHICAPAADPARLALARPEESYAQKQIQLRPRALAAYRRMVAAARAEAPAVKRDPRYFQIFSAFRSPAYDAGRCQREGNCNGIVRARCSPHRTGLAMDLYMGEAPGFGPDSSADANRRFMVHTPAYRWLVQNGARFGFVNYPFEPWHWEWTGENP